MGIDSENIEAVAADLEQTILDDLTARGLIQPVFTRKAKEYATMFRQKAAFDLDIEERGVMVWDERRQLLIDNPAVGQSIKLSNQMQILFRDLGFKEQAITSAKTASTTGQKGDEADDLLS